LYNCSDRKDNKIDVFKFVFLIISVK
jgi:hypothetical protein